MANVNSTWAHDPIDLSNNLSHASWTNPAVMNVPNGKILFKNDATFAYIAFDMTGDTSNDPVPAPADGDYFWLLFDRDRNTSVSSGVDTLYSPYKTDANKLGRSFVLTTNSTTGMTEQTVSQCRAAFEASPNSATAHKIIKVKLKIADLTTGLILPFPRMRYCKFGLRYHSTTPNILVESPTNPLANFARFNTLYFASKPAVPLPDLGPVFGSVGLIPTTKINASGKATTPAGYYVAVTNAAFGGVLNLIGNRTQMQALFNAGAVKYRIMHSFGTPAAFTNFRSAWSNYRWNGTDYVLESFGPDAGDFYPMPDPATDYSIDDLLLQVNSVGLSTGLHSFQVEFRNGSNGVVAAPTQTLSLFIDNAVPHVMINSITHNGANVSRCGIVNLTSATDGIRFNITASDAEGHLLGYALTAGWGNGDSETIVSKNYDPGTMGTSWNGDTNLNVPAAPAVWVPDESCAYGFTIAASANVTNGYGYTGYNSYSQYLTLIKP